MTALDRLPVLVGVGEASGKSLGMEWPSPIDLAGAAIKSALSDTGVSDSIATAIDTVLSIRCFHDSFMTSPFGGPDNVPEAMAKSAGLSPKRLIYTKLGGQSPQRAINAMAKQLFEGEVQAVMIAAGEALGTQKRAVRSGEALDWNIASDTPCEDGGLESTILSPQEISHGVISMPIAYSLIENARRGRLGMGTDEYALEMAEMWSALSGISEGNEHAHFAGERSAADLITEDQKNFRVTQPYMRWMVAQDAVDLGGALIMTTRGKALELGIAEDKLVYLTSFADADDCVLSERRDMSRSVPLDKAVASALAAADLKATDIDLVDIYSCFPCAVSTGIDAMNDPERPFASYSLTGGLSFFGGPGNGYAMHSLAAMVRGLRDGSAKTALITANGGVLSKQSVGIYSNEAPDADWTPETKGATISLDENDVVTPAEAPNGRGRVETYTVSYIKGRIYPPTIIAQMENGERAVCKMAELLDDPAQDILGHMVDIVSEEGKNFASLVG